MCVCVRDCCAFACVCTYVCVCVCVCMYVCTVCVREPAAEQLPQMQQNEAISYNYSRNVINVVTYVVDLISTSINKHYFLHHFASLSPAHTCTPTHTHTHAHTRVHTQLNAPTPSYSLILQLILLLSVRQERRHCYKDGIET